MAGIGSGCGVRVCGIVTCRILGYEVWGCYDTISYHSGEADRLLHTWWRSGHMLRYTAPVAFMDDETDLEIVLVILILVG